MGATAEDFLDAYRRNVARQTDAAVAESPICQLILLFMETRHSWTGSATDLLGRLVEIAEANRISTRARFWPNAPNALVRRMREAEPALASRGVEFRLGKSGSKKPVTLTRVAGNTVPTVPTAPEEGHRAVERDDSRDDTAEPIVPPIVPPASPRGTAGRYWDDWDDISGGLWEGVAQ